MTTLVIPDIHHRVGWIEACISELLPDLVVFLGDYFDEFFDTQEEVEMAAKWLKESLYKPNRIHLMGNHDGAYRFPGNEYMRCSGFHPAKLQMIEKYIKGKDWDKLGLCHEVDGFLLSHAGTHRMVFGNAMGEMSIERTQRLCKEAIENTKARIPTPYLGAGRARGGDQKYGGITWLDWNDEFYPVEEYKQIVGHTPHKNPVEKDGNWAIDTHSNHMALIIDGQVKIIENKWLEKKK